MLENESVSFGLELEDSAGVTFEWVHNGALIEGETAGTLNLEGVDRVSAGWYQVRATNAEGTSTSVAQLHVAPENGAAIAWGQGEGDWLNVVPEARHVMAVAAGGGFNLAVIRGGTVVAWGNDDNGRLDLPEDLSGVVAVAAGFSYGLALKDDGTVVAWGGENSPPEMTTVPEGLGDVVDIAAGGNQSFLLKADGTVVELGSQFEPTPAAATDLVDISVGYLNNYGLKADGTALAWGLNQNDQATPPDDLGPVRLISGGSNHSLAITLEGAVRTWGDLNAAGLEVPADLPPASWVGGGDHYSLMLSATGSVFGWGNHAVPYIIPPETVARTWAVSAGSSHAIALVAVDPPEILLPPRSISAEVGETVSFDIVAGGLPPLTYRWLHDGRPVPETPHLRGRDSNWLWVDGVTADDAGTYVVEVTNGVGTTSSIPVHLRVGQKPQFESAPLSQLVTVGDTLNLEVGMSTAGPFTYVWNKNGQAIPGAVGAQWSLANVQRSDAGFYEIEVSDESGVSASRYFELRVTDHEFDRSTAIGWGSVYADTPVPDVRHLVDVVRLAPPHRAFANPSIMALGDDSALTLVEVFGGAPADLPSEMRPVAIMAVSPVGFWATDVEGGLWHWGSDPTDVSHRGGARISSFVVTDNYVLGVRDDGRILLLGGDYTDAIQEHMPDYIAGVIQLEAMGVNLVARLQDGTVAGFGFDSFLEEIPDGLENVISISSGQGHVLALREGGSVVAWGHDYYGQSSVPDGLSGVRSIGANYNSSYALLENGTLQTWGNNDLGQLNVPSLDEPILDLALGMFGAFALIPGHEPADLQIAAPTEVVAAGSTVELQATATGSAPLAFQWFKDGAIMTNETDALLRLANVQASDIASYSVRVRNALGDLVSPAIPLDVTLEDTPPQIRHEWASTSVLGEAPVTLGSTLVGAVPLSYQWFYGRLGDESQPVPNGNAAEVEIADDFSGLYWLRTENNAGNLASSEGVLMRWVQENSGIAEGDSITLSYANGRFFALHRDRNEAMVSSEPGSWLSLDVTGAVPLGKVTFAFGRYFAPARAPYWRPIECVTSLDGIHWEQVDLPDSSVGFSQIAFDGVRLIALTTDGVVFGSEDGVSWTQIVQLADFRQGNLLVDPTGGFVCTGRDGYVARSVDGLVWTEETVPGEPELRYAAFDSAGRLVAMEREFANVSDDQGLTWSRHELPALPVGFTTQTGVAFGGGVWIAVQGAHLLHSLDGESWIASEDFVPLPFSHGSTHLSVVFGNGEFAVTSQEGRILRSLPLREALRGAPFYEALGVTSGDTVELSVSIEGPVSSYQWYEGRSGDTSHPLAGANFAEYQTNPLTETTSFWVRVSGEVEQVDSGTFEVVVAVPPTLISSPRSRDGIMGQELELRFEVSSEAPLDYQWYGGETGDESQPIAGANQARFVTQLGEYTRTYWARASNAAGAVDSDAATVTAWNVFNGHRGAQDMVEFQGRWYASDNSVVSSDNGRDWEIARAGDFVGFNASRLAVGNGTLMATGSRGMWQTRDGNEWLSVAGSGWQSGPYEGALAHGAGVWVSTFPRIGWWIEGEEWSYVEDGPTHLREIVFAADRFVAVGAENTDLSRGVVYSSFDGKTWKERSPSWAGDETQLRAISHGDAGFVAVGDGGTVIHSVDALSWTDTSPVGAEDVEFSSIAWGAGRYVAGAAGAGTVWWSEDGAAWQEVVGPEMMASDRIFYIADRFRAEGTSGWAYESVDGVNWELVSVWPDLGTAYSQNIDEIVPGLAAGNGLFMLLEPNQQYSEADTPTYVSTNGLDWRKVSSPGFVTEGLVHFGEWFVAVSSDEAGRGIRITQDGGSWETAMKWADNESLFRFLETDRGLVAITNQRRLYRSEDGEVWEQDPYDLPFLPSTLASSGSRFVMTDWRRVYVSSDLAHWAPVDFPFSADRFEGAAHGNGRWVLGTQFLWRYYTSIDGIEWEDSVQHVSGGAEELVFADGRFLGLERISLKWSEDGRNWVTDVDWYRGLELVGAPGRFPDQRVATLGNTTLVAGGTHLAISRRDPAVGGIVAVSGSQFIPEDAPIRLEVKAVGQGLTYQWYRGESGDTTDPLAQQTGAVLEIAPEDIAGDAVYWVKVSSGTRSWSSESLPVRVFPLPQISVDPIGQIVPFDGTISLSVEAVGTGPLIYQWWHDGNRIEDSDTATLVLDATDENVGGEYFAVAFDEHGSARSASAALVIPDAPVIIAEPADESVAVGEAAQFIVVAEGIDLRYQWRLNGVDLPDATNAVYSLNAVDDSDAGYYDVRISNRGGITWSVPVQLEIEGASSKGPALVVASGLIKSSSGRPGIMPFRIAGTGSKCLLLRVLGPAMAEFRDAPNSWVTDPELVLRDRTGAAISLNENWNEVEDGGDAVRQASVVVGAMPLAEGSLDAALVVDLMPGSYTLESNWSGSGKLVSEIWDLDSADDNPTSALSSIGIFSRVFPGVSQPFLTFVVPDSGAKEIVSRHLAPALQWSGDTLENPRLQILRGGASTEVVDATINWEPEEWPEWLLSQLPSFPPEPAAGDSMLINRLGGGTYEVEGWASTYDRGFSLLEVLDPFATVSPQPIVVLAPAKDVFALAGAKIEFQPLISAPSEPTYQWNFDGSPMAGANSVSLTIPDAQPRSEGEYTLTITSDSESLTTAPVELKVLGGGPIRVSHSTEANYVLKGGILDIRVEIEWDESPVDLAYEASLPRGWTYVDDDASTALETPTVDTEDLMTWRFGSPAGNEPLVFNYRIRASASAERTNYIYGEVVYTDEGDRRLSSETSPYSLTILSLAPYHDADFNRDRRLGLGELLRLIELYNTRFGSSRTGQYRSSESSVDGYAPDATAEAPPPLPRHHSADTDKDGRISLSELLRVIELYNTRSGTNRTGAYDVSEVTTDGFEPAP